MRASAPFFYRLAPIAILLLTAFLRLYQLPTLPPGLNFDEAGNGVAALDILRGAPQLWWRIGGGKEPLWPYLLAASTAVLGNVPLALRLPSAFIGIFSVAAVYPLMLGLFRSAAPSQARLLALFTMLGLAFSAWHLHFSRLGFRAILLPLLSSLAFYFFWRGIVSSRLSVISNQLSDIGYNLRRTKHFRSRFTFYDLRFSLNLSALLTALAIYAYLAARLLPLVPLLFLLPHWLITKIYHKFSAQPRQNPSSNPHAKRPIAPSSHLQYPKGTSSPMTNYRLLITNYFLPLLLFLLPLIIYFILNPADFTARAGAVSIFNAGWNNGDLLGTAWRTLRLTLSTFLGLDGDANPLVNLPHQPALPLFLAPFFILGLLTSVYHSLLPRPPAPLRPCSPSPPRPLSPPLPPLLVARHVPAGHPRP